MRRAFVEAELTFLPSHEGGRSNLDIKLSGFIYRPHIVVGDPARREAIFGPGNVLLEAYCGVAFAGGPEHIKHNVIYQVRMMLVYWPLETYDRVVAGAKFTLREGGRIVGFGRITNRWIGDLSPSP